MGEIKQKTMIISLLLLFVMVLSVSATFAADEDVALSEVNDETIIDEDVLSVEEDTDALEVDEEVVLETEDNSEVLGTSSVVTNSTFHDYFDSNGVLTSDDDELIFEGDFTGLDVSSIIVAGDHPVKFISNGVTLTNVQFLIMQSDVTIDGFKLIYDNGDGRLINVIGDNVLDNITISNNDIDFTAVKNYDSYAIFAGEDPIMGSNAVSNLNILNNVFRYVGNTNGSTINNVICIKGYEGSEDDYPLASSGIFVKNNKFNISMPSINRGWDGNRYMIIPISAGFEFYYCSDLTFNGNAIDLKYSSTDATGYDTIDVIDVRVRTYNDWGEGMVCENVTVSNNTINAVGNNYIYAMSIYGNDNQIFDNNINLIAEGYLAGGIYVEAPSKNVIVKNNSVALKAPMAAYGIYSYESSFGGIVNTVSILNNTVDVNAYTSCGMEFVGRNFNVESNEITASGNNTYGIALSNIDGVSTISKNIIACLGNSVGTIASGDNMVPANSSDALSVSGNVIIKNNDINSTDIGINAILNGEIEVTNNNIVVIANNANVENYAIKATEIDKLTLTNNNITFNGKTDGEKTVTNGMYVFDTEALVSNNEFNIVIPSAAILTDPITWEEIAVLSDGLVFDYVNNLVFYNNTVDVSYGDIVGYYDTLRGIDVSNSVNASFINNNIVATGNSYMYALKLGGDNFTIAYNDIIAVSDNYSNGINIEGASSGIIDNNNVSTSSPDSSYPIYVGMTSRDIDVNITNNNIFGRAYYVVGIEAAGNKLVIENNTIEVVGNHTIGIGAFVNELIVNSNNITSDASNEGNASVWDNLGTNTTGIKVAKGNSTITNNDIRTTGDYAIDLVGNNATITDNYLAAKKAVGGNSVTNATNAVISGSAPEIKSILTAVDLYTVYNEGDVFYVSLVDENGDPIPNATVFLSFDAEFLNETTDAYGVAAFLVDEWLAGDYLVDISYKGNATYGPKAIKGYISIQKAIANIVAPNSVNVLLTAVKKGSYYTITLKDNKDNGLAGEEVSITFNGKTQTYPTDDLGVIKFKLSATKVGTQKLVVKFDSNDNYVPETLTATVKINKEATKLTAKAKKFKAKKKTKKYTVVLKDSKGKAIKKAKVTIKVKGKTFKAKTNAKGKATLKIKKLNKKGTYKATVKFAGNNLYKAVSKKVKITVKK